MFMSYMHCSVIRNVTHEYWALVGVRALLSLVAPGGHFFVARFATGGGRVVTVTTLLFAVNICRRGSGVLILWRFRHWRHRRFSLWKSPVRMAARVWHFGWRRLCLGEQRLSFWWDYTYWYLNRHPIILWSRCFIVNSTCISFQKCLLWILHWRLRVSVDVTVSASLVAPWAVFHDNPRGHQRLRGRYKPVTLTTWLFSEYISSMPLSR